MYINCFSILTIALVLFLSLILAVNIFEISYSQNITFEESQTAITSYLDALIKAPLLISQALVVGVSFVNLFLFIKIIKKEFIFFNNHHNKIKNLFLDTILNNKLFVVIIVLSGVIILSMSTISVVYQASLLSFNIGLIYGLLL